MGQKVMPTAPTYKEQEFFDKILAEYPGHNYKALLGFVRKEIPRAREEFKNLTPHQYWYTYEKELPPYYEQLLEYVDQKFIDKLCEWGISFSRSGYNKPKKIQIFFMP